MIPTEETTTLAEPPVDAAVPNPEALAAEKPLSLHYAELCDQVFAELREGAESGVLELDAIRLLQVANRFTEAVATALGIPFGTVLMWPPTAAVAEGLGISADQLKGFIDQPLEGDQLRLITGYSTNVANLPNAEQLLRCFGDTFKEQADKLLPPPVLPR
jgi:hypothetical protein